MKYYYADAKNQPAGPVDLDELKRLLATNVITTVTNVIPEGTTTWVPLSSVLALSKSGETDLATLDQNGGLLANGPTILADVVGKILEKVRGLCAQALLEKLLWFCSGWGQVLLLLGAVLGLVYSLVLSIRAHEFRIFLAGTLAVLVIAMLQYVAKRFLSGCFSMIKASPSTMASAAVLDCFALVQLVGAACLLVGGLVSAIRNDDAASLVSGLVGFALWTLGAGVCLHPRMANVSLAPPGGAGDEALGLLSFILKLPLVLLPASFFAFGLVAVISIIAALFGSHLQVPLLLDYQFGQLGNELAGIGLLMIAAILPFLVYLGFLLGYLGLDVIRAIVSLPRKLDGLKK